MKKVLLILVVTIIIILSCTKKETTSCYVCTTAKEYTGYLVEINEYPVLTPDVKEYCNYTQAQIDKVEKTGANTICVDTIPTGLTITVYKYMYIQSTTTCKIDE